MKKLVLFFLFITFISLTFAYWHQETLIFHPRRTVADFKYSIKNPFEEIYLEVGPNSLHSIYIHSPSPHGLILYFHGNARSLAYMDGELEQLANHLDWDVWAIDYPGFGKSSGQISKEDELHQLSKYLYQAAENKYPTKKKIIYGRSLGSGLAVPLASAQKPWALILEAPFLSLKKMNELLYPWIPSFLLKYPLRNDLHFSQVTAPTLLLHGDRDELIPHVHSEDLAALSTQSTLWIRKIAGGGHNNLSHFENYWKSLKEFIKGLPYEP